MLGCAKCAAHDFDALAAHVVLMLLLVLGWKFAYGVAMRVRTGDVDQHDVHVAVLGGSPK